MSGRQRLDIPHARVRTAVANGRRVLTGIDGRSMVARRYRELAAAISSDLGGDLTEAQLQLVRSAAGLVILRERLDVKAVNEEPVNALQYCRITGTLRRVLATIGLHRVPRDVTPSSFRDRLAAEIEEIDTDEVEDA